MGRKVTQVKIVKTENRKCIKLTPQRKLPQNRKENNNACTPSQQKNMKQVIELEIKAKILTKETNGSIPKR